MFELDFLKSHFSLRAELINHFVSQAHHEVIRFRLLPPVHRRYATPLRH